MFPLATLFKDLPEQQKEEYEAIQALSTSNRDQHSELIDKITTLNIK
jgi:hypothetical protein